MDQPPTFPAVPSVITIGVFDGVHRGHQALIEHAVRGGGEYGLRTAAVTFDPPPVVVLRQLPRQQLTTLDDRIALLQEAGVEHVEVVQFTTEIASMHADEFIGSLCARLSVQHIVVGEDFRLGRGREAGWRELASIGQALGFGVTAVPLLQTAGERVSSSRIRALLRDEGNVECARQLLGRAHFVRGEVVRGAGRGTELGVPTANVAAPREVIVPLDGVYVGSAVAPGWDSPVRAAISVGTNPTFSGRERTVEAHLIDWSGDLYGRHLTVTFARRLREQRRYESVDELVEQMRRDVAAAREADLSPLC